jgi:Family of unknown function (DUF6454)
MITCIAFHLLLAVLSSARFNAGFQIPERKLEQLEMLQVIPLAAPLHHVQGIDIQGDRIYVSSVDRATRKGYLHLLKLPSGEVVRQVEVQEGSRFHPGGIALSESFLWIPVAEYQRDSSSSIQQRDKTTLGLLYSFVVQDHIGCVAADQKRIIGGNWDSRQIYSWDLLGKLIEKKDNPSSTAYQDMKIVGELVASGALSRTEGSVDWLDPWSLQLQRRIRAGVTDRGVRFTNEGMAIRDGKLYLLPEDGPSRLFVFQLP